MSRFSPDEPEPTRRDESEDEHDEPNRCPHGYILAPYEAKRSGMCEDCAEDLAQLQQEQSVGK